MRLKLVGILAVLALILCVSAAKTGADEKKSVDSGYIKVEMKGQLRLYRMILFGETAAAVWAGNAQIWLDYSKNETVKKKIVSLDEKTVVVKGKLEFRDFSVIYETERKGGDGPKPFSLRGQPVIVVESLEEVK